MHYNLLKYANTETGLTREMRLRISQNIMIFNDHMKFQYILPKEVEVGSWNLARTQIKIKIHKKSEVINSSNAQCTLIPSYFIKSLSLGLLSIQIEELKTTPFLNWETNND